MSYQNQPLEISVIIPTLNEEKRISQVISQFEELEEYYRYEVIIGDGGSIDRTVEIARSLGASVAIDASPQRTVAGGRNAGAAAARGDILVFCDADTHLSDVRRLAGRIQHEFRDASVVAAVPMMEVEPESQQVQDRLFHFFFNLLIRLSLYSPLPFSRGQCQIIRADAFRMVGGYNARQVHAEDSSIFQKLSRVGKLRFISDVIIFESPRRYRKYGYLQLSLRSVYSIVGQAMLKRNILPVWERVD